MKQLITVDTPATLTAKFYPSGSDTGLNDGTVTVAVTAADGTTIAGVGAVSAGTAGVYTASLPAQTTLGVLTATWTGATSKVRTTHEIVGAQLVEIAEIRAQLNITSSAKYPNATLDDARAWFLDIVTDHCGFSPVPRYVRETADGSGTGRLQLTNRAYIRTLRSVSVDAVDVADLTGWDLDTGILYRKDGIFAAGRNNVVVAYEHGLDQASADLRRAALTAIRYRVLTDALQQIPDRATALQTETGTIQYSQPDENNPTGLRDVDAVLNRLRLVTVA